MRVCLSIDCGLMGFRCLACTVLLVIDGGLWGSKLSEDGVHFTNEVAATGATILFVT
jgi:hypothetical protein